MAQIKNYYIVDGSSFASQCNSGYLLNIQYLTKRISYSSRGPVLRSKMHEFVGEEKNDDP
ncbi:hypothetical protein CIPAW_01G020200 [Carya illinoinensis]|uniref:Uncharacterized protein n=1 Tax=Carya illinoinensis TaxID=32201 RepID=A0A8T1RJP4_CARIL|nr:hypothetical protein CIPAW_01G020200 [Carya illinoinensis]